MKRLHPAPRGHQRGITLVMVLIMMTAMLLGALALARMTEAGALISGNVAAKEGSMHASEVGWNVAYAQVKALTNENTSTGGWYFATIQPTDANGIPTTINFDATPVVAGGVGRYTVTYAVERMCTVADVVASARECLVKQLDLPENREYDPPDHQPKASRQFRITVRATDARGTQTWTQSMVTKGG
jgi:type IV pilus assembly protein PilX